MRISLAALALGISAVMVPSSAYATTASFEVADYQLEGQCVNHTFDVNLSDTSEPTDMTITVTDPEQTVVHTLRTKVQPEQTRIEDMEMVFCRYNLVAGTYTISADFPEAPAVQARMANPETFEVYRAPVVTPTPETSSAQTGWVRVSKVARGTKVVFRAGTEDQVWKVRVKGTTRRVKVEAGQREVKVYNARTVRIKTLGQRVF